jgi:HTH-like domain
MWSRSPVRASSPGPRLPGVSASLSRVWPVGCASPTARTTRARLELRPRTRRQLSCGSCAGGTSSWSKRTRFFVGQPPTSLATRTQNDVPAVLDLTADHIPVAVTCRVLGFSKQAFYQWKASPVSQRDWDDAHLINAAIDIHHDDPEFGYRFITDELAERGVVAGRNRVNRLCTLQRIWSVHARKRPEQRI